MQHAAINYSTNQEVFFLLVKATVNCQVNASERKVADKTNEAKQGQHSCRKLDKTPNTSPKLHHRFFEQPTPDANLTDNLNTEH